MKKHIRFILTVCLVLCTVLCLSIAAACDLNGNGNGNADTFTIIVKHGDGTPYEGISVSACRLETCIPGKTDRNGKAVYDISVDLWVDAEELHAQVTVKDGFAAYDEDGNICSVNEGLSLPGFYHIYEAYVNHHEVKSITFIIKENSASNDA